MIALLIILIKKELIYLKTNKKSINKIKFDKLILCCGTLGSTVLINKYLKFRFVKLGFIIHDERISIFN